MTQRSTLAPEDPVQSYPFEPFLGRFNIFCATQRLRCHNQRYVLLSRFEVFDAAEPYFSTYILIKEGAAAPVACIVPIQHLRSGQVGPLGKKTVPAAIILWKYLFYLGRILPIYDVGMANHLFYCMVIHWIIGSGLQLFLYWKTNLN